MNEQAHKLTEYAYAAEQIKKAKEAQEFLRRILGTYEADKNLMVARLDGYIDAMTEIIRQAEL